MSSQTSLIETVLGQSIFYSTWSVSSHVCLSNQMMDGMVTAHNSSTLTRLFRQALVDLLNNYLSVTTTIVIYKDTV
jgi:hypothetical protein